MKCAIDKDLISAMNIFNKTDQNHENRYEALLVLNTQGREDTVKEVVDRLESEFQKEGAANRAGPENGQTPVFLRGRRARRRILR